MVMRSLPVHAQAGPDATWTTEEVTFESDGVSLAGSLLIPAGPGPFPALVIVHGSGSSDRSNPWTSAYAAALVERGVAVLHPDKRGSGSSGGNWREADFGMLANDALAGLHAVRTHPSIDADRVGLIGFSQGGHIVPLAATRSPHVALVVNVSGSVVPMMEQIGDEIRMMGIREGLDSNQLKALQAVHDRAVEFVLTGNGWDAYRARLDEAKEGVLKESDAVSGFPADPDSPAWTFLRTMGNFDPMPYWREVQVPTLFLYGGRDQNVDVLKSAARIQEELTLEDLPYTLMLFRNNGHALFRDDAMDFVARWVSDGGVD